MKILTVIANFGSKNERFLKQLITSYRAMSYSVDIVVLSNVPKNIGPDIEVVVGLPDPDPWSLPFGHKAIMKSRKDDYDLFIYSEDDTLITEETIAAFLDATKYLGEDEIAGFLRYEIGPDGQKYCSTIHGGYFWDPRSIRRRGPYIMAHYTNVHSGGFILTANQLKKCLDSGGFMKGVRKGSYDMLCTAATDPYTQCGLQKLVPISHIDRFLLAHLPNVYLGRIGIKFEDLVPQIKKMIAMGEMGKVGEPLFETRTGLGSSEYDKQYFNDNLDYLKELANSEAVTYLTVGSGWAKDEAALQEMGKKVTIIPLDEVIGSLPESVGIEVMEPNLDEALDRLKTRRFDCIILNEVLEHFPKPQYLLVRLAQLLDKKGQMLICIRNHRNLRYWKKRWLNDSVIIKIDKISDFSQYQYRIPRNSEICAWLQAANLYLKRKRYLVPATAKFKALRTFSLAHRWFANKFVITAARLCGLVLGITLCENYLNG